jgi:hypothetical protein
LNFTGIGETGDKTVLTATVTGNFPAVRFHWISSLASKATKLPP